MSYIRALSNPEAMYAYGSTGSRTYISANTCVDKEGNHIELSLPGSVFFGLFRKWIREGYPEDVSFRGARLVELTGGVDPNAWKWRLSYKDWKKKSIVAHKVTWFYVAQNVTSR